MKKFGQEVFLHIEDAGGRAILEATELRVDFDIRHIDTFSRGTVTIYNLNEQTIANLIGGNNDHYATLKVRLHGGEEHTIMDSFFISNMIDEKKIPNNITTLYCYSKIKVDVLEKQVDIPSVIQPSLKNIVDYLMQSAGFEGKVTYNCFAEGATTYLPPRPNTPEHGSVASCLNDLSKEHKFNYYTMPDEIRLVYKPNAKDRDQTNLDTLPKLLLHTENMRANPKLAPAQLQITSNLDPDIEPSLILDISKLLTAGISTNPRVLEVADNFAKDAVAGYNLYQTLAVQHRGSNYTDQWHTIVSAVSPTEGKQMPVTNWWR